MGRHLGDTLRLKASLARSSGDITVQAETGQGTSARVAAGVKEARLSLQSEGEAVTVALRWDSERAGSADGQLRTRLARAPATAGGGWLWPADAPLAGQLRAQLPRIGVWSVLAPPGWRLRGSLGADVAISGTRAAPQLAGDLQANDLALRSVVDGIEFGNGRLRAKLDGTRMRINEFTLQGAGDKGTGGVLTAQGEAGWVEGKPQVAAHRQTRAPARQHTHRPAAHRLRRSAGQPQGQADRTHRQAGGRPGPHHPARRRHAAAGR
jgi:translocation and assembly module TamB